MVIRDLPHNLFHHILHTFVGNFAYNLPHNLAWIVPIGFSLQKIILQSKKLIIKKFDENSSVCI